MWGGMRVKRAIKNSSYFYSFIKASKAAFIVLFFSSLLTVE